MIDRRLLPPLLLPVGWCTGTGGFARVRVLGLSQTRTRLVAATETLLLLGVGLGAGALLYLGTRSAMAEVWFAAAQFPLEGYRASTTGWLTSLVGVPALALAIAFGPVTRDSSTALRDDRSRARPRAGWRNAILLTGTAALLAVVNHARLGVPGHQVGGSRVIGGRPPSELWWRSVL